MAHFSFKTQIWRVKDANWMLGRKAQWNRVEGILLSNQMNKVELSSIKKYFMKGEWSPDTKYAPRGGDLFLYSPKHSIEIYDTMLECSDSQIKINIFRKGVFNKLLSGLFHFLTDLSEDEKTQLLAHIMNGQTEYTEDKFIVNGCEVSVFPEQLSSHINGYFWSYLRGVKSLLNKKNGGSVFDFSLQLPLWMSSIRYLDKWDFSKDFKRAHLLDIFVAIAHYIPHHNSNSGAQEKARFVKDFRRLANDMGFSNDLVASTWKLAQESKEDEWVDHLYQCTKDEDSYAWDSSDFALFTNLVYRSKVYQGDMVDAIYQRYAKNGFIADGHVFNQSYIDVTELLTQDFIAELAVSNSKAILGRLTRLELSEKFMGTSKVSFSLDIIAIDCKGNHEREVPRILIIERPTDFYVAADARRYCANRQFMVDDIKAETGIELVRYFGFDQNPILERTYPPRPQDYLEYEKEMERPFYNASYLPLKTGSTAFILNDENEYVVVPDRPTIL